MPTINMARDRFRLADRVAVLDTDSDGRPVTHTGAVVGFSRGGMFVYVLRDGWKSRRKYYVGRIRLEAAGDGNTTTVV